MKLSVTSPDPFHILASTKVVMEGAKFVSLNEKALKDTAKKIEAYLKGHADFSDQGHHIVGDYQTDAQLIFFESMMAFCFWSLPGKAKWCIELGNGEKVDGWYGACAAFQGAYEDGLPVAEANFFATATRRDIQHIFRSASAAEIPLLETRVAILRDNARILNNHFGGQAVNLIEASRRDAVKLFGLLLKHFPSYRDIATYNGHEVVFLKLAHIVALDLEYRLTPKSKRPFLKHFDELCVFADYKLPQLLRMFGVLVYTKPLQDLVDSYTVIAKGSPEEIELRSGAVWGVELIHQRLPHYSSVQIGHAIWLMSQDQTLQARIKPYHRTYTTFY